MYCQTSSVEDEQTHPRKRQRLDMYSQDGWAADHSLAMLRDTADQGPKVRLDSLPAEILDIILHISAEASLIHISRKLWQRLPFYVPYTKRLAFEALLPLKEWKEAVRLDCPSGETIADIESYLTPEVQDAVREKIFSTYWFRERHVNHVRQILLRWSILKACSVFFERPPSPSQLKRIRLFVENQRTPNIGTELNLRLRCENTRSVYLTATTYEVEVSERRNSFYQASEFRVLDFGNIVPDFLLQHPLTPAKQAMIRGICKWKDAKLTEITCNLDSLRRLILDCIIFDHLTTFYELLKLASFTDVILDLIHIERIVMLGRSRMLTPLLKQTWRQGNVCRFSDMQLIALIDQAKANGYCNWAETTRVLAMEVAALWKMAEVERVGGTVSRALVEWPPRLCITMPGDGCAQSWFIPKDPRYEVDWESSEFRGWIQMRMYTP